MSENPWELEDAYVAVATRHGTRISETAMLELVVEGVSPAELGVLFERAKVGEKISERTQPRGPRRSKRLPKPFLPEELERLFRAAQDRPDVLAAMIFLHETGMRSAEALSISREEAASWPKPPWWCWREWCPRHMTSTRIIGKGNKERVAPISKLALGAARTLLRYPKRDTLMPWSDRGLRYVVAEMGRRAGVEKAHPHRFRHTYASELVEAGVAIEIVSDLMGHSKTDITRLYWSASLRAKRRALHRRGRRR